GEAKWWLVEAHQRGLLDRNDTATHPAPLLPFEELQPWQFRMLKARRSWLRRLGYYELMG
ncbi:hypothetical protein E8M65_13650, partial [Neisseria gonorrhoeae]